MSNSIIRDCDHYVILEPSKTEKFLSKEETLLWLEEWLKKIEKLPDDLVNKTSLKDAAHHLLDTACSLEVKSGFNLQWFAVRLDPQGF